MSMAKAASQRSQAAGSTCFLLVVLQQRPFCVISSHDLHDACHAATRMTPLWMLCKSGPPLAWRCWCPGPQAASSELRGGCEALLCVKATRRGLILLLAAAAEPAAKEPHWPAAVPDPRPGRAVAQRLQASTDASGRAALCPSSCCTDCMEPLPCLKSEACTKTISASY